MEFACLDLVNSEEWDGFGRRTDHLDDPAWVTSFLTRWGLGGTETPAARLKAELVRLRTLLRRMVEDSAAGRQPSDADLMKLDPVLAAVSVQRRLMRSGDEYQMVLVPIAPGERWTLAELAASAVNLLTQHDRRRVKVCANQGCRWAFYDESRGKTRRWCDDRTCGNRDKVRRFRARRSGAKPG